MNLADEQVKKMKKEKPVSQYSSKNENKKPNNHIHAEETEVRLCATEWHILHQALSSVQNVAHGWHS